MMNFDDEALSAYLDGEVDAETRKQIDEALVNDEGLARRFELMRKTEFNLRRAYEQIELDPLPARTAALLAEAPPERPSNVLSFVRRPASWMTLAASVAALMFVGVFLENSSHNSGGAQLSALLDRAELGETLQYEQAQLRLLLSYTSNMGSDCKYYQLVSAQSNKQAVACKESGVWVTKVEEEFGSGDEYRPASGTQSATQKYIEETLKP